MQSTKKDLVKLWANADKRKEFLKNYKEWGDVWLTVPELGLSYYKYDLPGKGHIITMEYSRHNPYPRPGDEPLQTITVYYLWESEFFNPSPSSEYTITDRLKQLKLELQTKLRADKPEQ